MISAPPPRRRVALLLAAAASGLLIAGLVALAVQRGTRDTATAPGWLRTDDGRLPDVVVLTVDTLRADHVFGRAPSNWQLTPRLAELAGRGTLFTGTYTAAPATKPGLASLMSGAYVHRHHVASNFGSVPPDMPLLATILQRRGYTTAAFVGNEIVNQRSGLQRGFAYFSSFVDKNRISRDATGVDEAIAWLASAPRQPWLLWLHLMAPHGPYNSSPRDPGAESTPDSLPDVELHPGDSNYGIGPIIPRYQILAMPPQAALYRGRYRDEVLYVDAQVGRFLDALGSRGDATPLVIVTADHGEGLGENDYFFQHGWLVNEPALRVPMIWSLPGRISEGYRVNATTSLVDVLPTLLAGLGIDPPPVDGRDLSRSLRGADPSDGVVFALSAYANELTTAIRGRWKLVHTPPPPLPLPRDHWHDTYPKEESWVLHDLQGDPLEKHDASATQPEIANDLREQLTAWERMNGLPFGARSVSHVDPGTVEGLRALGYVD